MITDPHTEAIRKENESLRERLARLEAAMSGKDATPAFVGERPQYRLLGPFYGPDDVLYDPEDPTQSDIINWSGVPNDKMEPLNEPARRRMTAWLESLPGKGILPLEFIVEAASLHKSDDAMTGDAKAAFAGVIMTEAIKLRNKAQGRPAVQNEISMPHKVENVPISGGGRRQVKPGTDSIEMVASPRRQGRPRRVMGSGGPPEMTNDAIDIG